MNFVIPNVEDCRFFCCKHTTGTLNSCVMSGETELFNDWGGQGCDDSVPVEVTKTAPSGVRTA